MPDRGKLCPQNVRAHFSPCRWGHTITINVSVENSVLLPHVTTFLFNESTGSVITSREGGWGEGGRVEKACV